jgi:hypothetical protein
MAPYGCRPVNAEPVRCDGAVSFRPGGHLTAKLAAAKRRLILCTVPGSTPDCLATTRTPGRPGVARASRIRGAPEALTLTPGPRKPLRNHRPLELGKHAHHLKQRRNRSILSARRSQTSTRCATCAPPFCVMHPADSNCERTRSEHFLDFMKQRHSPLLLRGQPV